MCPVIWLKLLYLCWAGTVVYDAIFKSRKEFEVPNFILRSVLICEKLSFTLISVGGINLFLDLKLYYFHIHCIRQ